MTRRERRPVQNNHGVDTPAEPVTSAQAELHAELQPRQPDDPGVAEWPDRSQVRDDFDHHALRAPVRALNDPGPMRVVALVAIAAGVVISGAVILALAWAWGL